MQQQEQLYRQKERNCQQEKQKTATSVQRQNDRAQKAQQLQNNTNTKVSEATFTAMRQAALSMFKQRTKDLTKVAELQQEMTALEVQLAQVQGATTQLQHLQANLQNAIEVQQNKVKQRTEQVHAAHEHVRQLAEEQAQINTLSKNTSKVALLLRNFVHDVHQDGSQLRYLCAQVRRIIDRRSLHDFRSLCGELRRRRYLLQTWTMKMKLNTKQQKLLNTTQQQQQLQVQKQQIHKQKQQQITNNQLQNVQQESGANWNVNTDWSITQETSKSEHNKFGNSGGSSNTKVLADFTALFAQQRTELLNMLQQWLGQSSESNKSSQQMKNMNSMTMVNGKQSQAKWQEYEELQDTHTHMRDLLQSIMKSKQIEEQRQIAIDKSNSNKNNANVDSLQKPNETANTTTIENNEVFPALPLVKIIIRQNKEWQQLLNGESSNNDCNNADFDVIIPDVHEVKTSDTLINQMKILIDKYTSELSSWCVQLQRVHDACTSENIHLCCDVITKPMQKTSNENNDDQEHIDHNVDEYGNEENESNVFTESNNNDNTKGESNQQCQRLQCVLMQSIDGLKQKWQAFCTNYCEWIHLREQYIEKLQQLKQLQDQVRNSKSKWHRTQTHITQLQTNTLHDNMQHTAILAEEVENYVVVATRAHHTLIEQAKAKKELQNKIKVQQQQALVVQEQLSRNELVEAKQQAEWTDLISDLYNALRQQQEKRKCNQLQPQLDKAQELLQLQTNKLTEVNAVCDKLMQQITSTNDDDVCNIDNAVINNFDWNNCNSEENGNTYNAMNIKTLSCYDSDFDGNNNVNKLSLLQNTVTLLPQDVHMLGEAQIKQIVNVLISFTCNDDDNSMNTQSDTYAWNEDIKNKQIMPDVLAMQLTQQYEKERVKVPMQQQRPTVQHLWCLPDDTASTNNDQQQQHEHEHVNDKSDNKQRANDTVRQQNQNKNDMKSIKNGTPDLSAIVRYWASLLPASVCKTIGQKLQAALQEKQANVLRHEKEMQRIAKNIELLQQVCSQVQQKQCEQKVE